MEERVKSLEARVTVLEDNKSDVRAMMAVVTEKLDNIVKSLDKLSLQYEKNISELNDRYDNLEEKYDKLKEEINRKTIEKDAEKWNKIVITIITGIVSVLIGFFVGKG